MSDTSAVPPAKQRLVALLREALQDESFVRLTLGGSIGKDRTLRNVVVRSVILRGSPKLSVVYRHATRDITKNYSPEEGCRHLETLIGKEFRTAHLFTSARSAQLEYRRGQEPQIIIGKPVHARVPPRAHDRVRQHSLQLEQARWLVDLGVTTAEGKVAKGMEAKFRQIQKFVEVLRHLLAEAHLLRDVSAEAAAAPLPDEPGPAAPAATDPERPLTLVDMGCGKGYLTFAACEALRSGTAVRAAVLAVDTRQELVDLANEIAKRHRFGELRFERGDIASTRLAHVDALVALHACDTATDDAIAKGIQAGASLILVSPCCHKEVRPQLRPPAALRCALRHGILQEREAEFATDALRAALLEWAGYDARVFEFISPEHTSKNLMIAGLKRRFSGPRGAMEQQVRDLAGFYGIQSQRLAGQLGFDLNPSSAPTHGRA